MITLLFMATTVSAQFYVSGTAGYAFAAGEKELGKKITALNKSEDLKGSYGKGMPFQIRGGYFFAEKLGVELGVGYLLGAEADVQKVMATGMPTVDMKAKSRAYGASLSLVYNLTSNIYARAGLLTKIGGKTILEGEVEVPEIGLDIDFKTDFHGKPPLGFIGALGYALPITDNIAIFGEVEYMGISVARDKSKLQEFSAKYAGKEVTKDMLLMALKSLPAQVQGQFKSLLPLLSDEAEWGKGDLPSKKAPYSSIGVNIGISYSFGM